MKPSPTREELSESSPLSEVISCVEGMKSSGKHDKCPACQQTVKVYKRALNKPMAQILGIIHAYYKLHSLEEWLHVDEHLKSYKINCRYYSLLRFWGLIEQKDGLRPDGSNRLGYWRITEKGKMFVEGQIKVPKFFYMFNQGVEESLGELGFSADEIGFKQIVEEGKAFDYRDINNLELNVN